MDLLGRTLERNPALIEAAIALHQRGEIPAGSFVIDLEAVARNAVRLAQEARRHSLYTYAMTKSYGRHPLVTQVALASGIDSTVAVEPREAHIIGRFNLPVGHVGHLGSIPLREAAAIVDLNPDAVTVYTTEAAAAVNQAASTAGRVQDVYMRVNREGDELFRGLVGGWSESDFMEAARAIVEMRNLNLAGLTSFPCISYGDETLARPRPTRCFFTMMKAKQALEAELGIGPLRVNAPAMNCCATLGVLAAHGATEVEPGTALLGGSLVHAARNLAEEPAQVFVGEVSHRWQNELYVTGGGMAYLETYGYAEAPVPECVVGTSLEDAVSRRATFRDAGVVNYYAVCSDVPSARIGDSAVFALHPQYFMNRAYAVAVSGIGEQTATVEGVVDHATNVLDGRFGSVSPTRVSRRWQDLAERVSREAAKAVLTAV